jgi:hypothetical protein
MVHDVQEEKVTVLRTATAPSARKGRIYWQCHTTERMDAWRKEYGVAAYAKGIFYVYRIR